MTSRKVFDLQVNVSALKRCDWGRILRIEDDAENCNEEVTTIEVMHSDEIPTYFVRVCETHCGVLAELASNGDVEVSDDLDRFIIENMKDPEFRAAYERLQKNNDQFAALMKERNNGR